MKNKYLILIIIASTGLIIGTISAVQAQAVTEKPFDIRSQKTFLLQDDLITSLQSGKYSSGADLEFDFKNRPRLVIYNFDELDPFDQINIESLLAKYGYTEEISNGR